MKDFSLAVLYAIVHEFLGGYFWLTVAIVLAIGGLALIAFLRRAENPHGTGLLSVAAGILGGGAAMLVAPRMTNAGFDNLHGALDWMALAVIGVAAALAFGFAAYGMIGTFMSRTASRRV